MEEGGHTRLPAVIFRFYSVNPKVIPTNETGDCLDLKKDVDYKRQ